MGRPSIKVTLGGRSLVIFAASHFHQFKRDGVEHAEGASEPESQDDLTGKPNGTTLSWSNPETLQ